MTPPDKSVAPHVPDNDCVTEKGPIFLHSLWRAGSTYMFNVFRRARPLYTCYQEAIHEIALEAIDNPQVLLQISDLGEFMRHPALDQPYFQELSDAYPRWAGLVRKELIYDQYFDNVGSNELVSYLGALIDASTARPVFHECRTSSRIAACKAVAGGYHVYLLRNPHDQWWSMLKSSYFSNSMLMILNCEKKPAALQCFAQDINFYPYHTKSISDEFQYFDKLQYRADIQYKLFFIIWVLAYQHAYEHADMITEMERLSHDSSCRNDVLRQWRADASIAGIDLSDCLMPERTFSEAEIGFFRQIEDEVLERYFAAEQSARWMKPLIGVLAGYGRAASPAPEVFELRTTALHVIAKAASRLDLRQEELSGQLESMHKQLIGAEQLHEQAEDKRNSLQRELDRENSRRMFLVGKIIALRREKTRTEEAVHAVQQTAEMEIAYLSAEVSAQKSQVTELCQRLQLSLNRRRASVRRAAERHQRIAERLRAEIQEAVATAEELRHRTRMQAAEIESGLAELAEAQSLIADLHEQLAGERQSGAVELAEAQSLIADLHEQLVGERQSRAVELAETQSRIAHLGSELAFERSLIQIIVGAPFMRLGSVLGLLPKVVRNLENLSSSEPDWLGIEKESYLQQLSHGLATAPVDNTRQNHSGMQMNNLMEDIETVDQLLMLNGADFVEQAYRSLLKRSADRSGRAHFLARLRAGDGKEAIVRAIAMSPEARAMRSGLAGVEDLLARQVKKGRLPNISRRLDHLERLINRFECSLGESQDRMSERIDQIEAMQVLPPRSMRGEGKEPEALEEAAASRSVRSGISIFAYTTPASFLHDLKNAVRSSAEAAILSTRSTKAE